MRTRELEQANARLAVLDKDKSDFLTLISHELRTPLHGLFGVADLLFLEAPRTPVVEEYIGMFEQARQRLLSLLEDALLLTQLKIEGGGPAAVVPDLRVLVASAWDQVASLAAARQVRLGRTPDATGPVIADASLLERALGSLLATAIRFSHAALPVTVTGGRVDSWVELEIVARGRSVPPALLPRFFEVLAINESLVPGADLGLAPAVAERIISGFGGAVTVANLDPSGIQIRVRLRRPSGTTAPLPAG
jgi:signal transduction histidine kinase